MTYKDMIDIDIFKVVTRAVSKVDTLDTMANYLTQALTSGLGIKGSTLFVLNPETDELEVLASAGLSLKYLNKGPVFSEKGLVCSLEGGPIVIRDVSDTDRLQYPGEAKEEGIAAIMSVPVEHNNRFIGCLRLYHHEVWDISDKDIDSLMVLGEHIGLALTYNRIKTAMQSLREVMDQVHTVWLSES